MIKSKLTPVILKIATITTNVDTVEIYPKGFKLSTKQIKRLNIKAAVKKISLSWHNY